MESSAEQQFTAWSRTRVARLHRVAFLLTGDWALAEDLVQEALERTAQNWTKIERLEHPDAYVRKVLVNQASSRWRRRWSSEVTTDRLPDTPISDGSSDRAERAELVSALRSLPPRQRAAVVLRYFEQLSEAETAAALDCSIGTVKSTTHRALTALRKELTPGLPEGNLCSS